MIYKLYSTQLSDFLDSTRAEIKLSERVVFDPQNQRILHSGSKVGMLKDQYLWFGGPHILQTEQTFNSLFYPEFLCKFSWENNGFAC